MHAPHTPGRQPAGCRVEAHSLCAASRAANRVGRVKTGPTQIIALSGCGLTTISCLSSPVCRPCGRPVHAHTGTFLLQLFLALPPTAVPSPPAGPWSPPDPQHTLAGERLKATGLPVSLVTASLRRAHNRLVQKYSWKTEYLSVSPRQW